jgi:hypothetical protein
MLYGLNTGEIQRFLVVGPLKGVQTLAAWNAGLTRHLPPPQRAGTSVPPLPHGAILH